MSKKMKFVLNRKGVGELLNGQEMKNLLSTYGNNTQAKAGRGYEADVVKSSDRLKVLVKATTNKAKRDNLKNNTLLKALK